MRLPRLLDDCLNEVDRLHPSELSAELQKRACSTAKMTLPDEDPRLDRMPFAELYSAKGSLGIFRVYDSTEPVDGSRTYTLRHAIDTLRDSVWRARTDFSGTVSAFLTALLSYQTVTRWQLGTCADAGNYKRDSINYDHLDALLDELREAREGYYFTYDFSTTPWTLNFVAETGTVDAELRASRNLQAASLRRTRNGQVNRLYLAVKNGRAVTYSQYDDTASQAEYGVLEGTATVDSAEVSDPAAWAAQFLEDHGAPIPSANLDGWELVKTTGEQWDALDIGKTARVAAPRPGYPFELPIEALRFENLAGDEPEKVRAELNRRLPRFSEKLAQAQKAGGGAGRRSKENAEKIRQFETYEIKNDEMIGMVAHAMGVVLDSSGYPVVDAQTGKLVYDQNSAAEIFTHLILSYNRAQLVSAINDGTGAQVSGSKVDLSAQGDVLIQAINATGGSSIKLSADVITLDGATVALSLEGQYVECENLVAGEIDVGGSLVAEYVQADDLVVDGDADVSGTLSAAAVMIGNADVSGAVADIGPATASGGQITIPWTKLDGTAGTPVNFNIAATQYYIDGVAAAETTGWNAARAMVTPPSQGTGTTFDVLVPAATQNQQQTYAFTIQKGATPASSGYASVALSGIVVGRIAIGDWYDAGVTSGAAGVDFDTETAWSSGSKTLILTNGKTGTVTIPATGSWNNSKPSANRYSYNCTVGGRTLYSYADFSGWGISYNASGATISFSLGGQNYSHFFAD